MWGLYPMQYHQLRQPTEATKATKATKATNRDTRTPMKTLHFRPWIIYFRPLILMPLMFRSEPIFNDSKIPSLHDQLISISHRYYSIRDRYTAPQHPIVLCHGLSGFDRLIFLYVPYIGKLLVRGLTNESEAKEILNRELAKAEEDNRIEVTEKKPVTEKSVVIKPEETTQKNDDVNHFGFSPIAIKYWYGIEEALANAGVDVITAKVPPFESIEDRARLLDQLLTKTFNKNEKGERVKINLVGHSMGGLDARYLISKIQNENSPYQVVSLTTVGTPHHGSQVADFVMNLLSKDDLLLDSCPRAIPQLTTGYCEEFNKEVLDDPSVAYFSYGALMKPAGIQLFRLTYEIVKKEILRTGSTLFDNDGMVSVDLTKWGNYVGTLDDVDHLDLINWTNTIPLPFAPISEFKPVALYLDIADTLANSGF